MHNIDFTEYDRTFSKNAVILEKCSFKDDMAEAESDTYIVSKSLIYLEFHPWIKWCFK
jgi:hypothetical protein